MYKDKGTAIYNAMKAKGIEDINLFNAPLFRVDVWRNPQWFYINDENEVTLTFCENCRYWDYSFYLDFADDVDFEFADNEKDYEKVLTEMGVDELLNFIKDLLK